MDVSLFMKYAMSVTNLAFSAAADLFVISNRPGIVTGYSHVVFVPLALSIAQRDGVTLLTNEHIGVRVSKFGDAVVTGTATTYANALTAVAPLEVITDPAYYMEFDVMCGTLTTGTTERKLLSDGWNVQAPYLYQWGPDERPVMSLLDDDAGAEDAFVVRLENAPSTAIDINATLLYGLLGPVG